MRKIGFCLLIAICAVAVGACSRQASDGKRVLAVSIDPQKKLLEQLVGDNFEIVTILANGANPETFEPSMSQRLQAHDAMAYFTIGYLPFEHDLARGVSSGTIVVDTSAGIEPLTGTHDHGDGHADEADPHVWTSLRNGKLIASNMLDALVQLDPDNDDEYRCRYLDVMHRLDSLDAQVAGVLAQSGAHAFAVWHPSLSYFARDYGLHQIAVGQESKELSIGTLRDIIEEAKADSVRVFFFQQEYDSRQAENLNREIGSRFVVINPLDYDWDTQIIEIANELAR